ncbi:hemagglutinin repeat-containing protein [Enterobacter roggenkampii]|uniref:hemagglutinin repeat-containing protein n=1 Tax=Enterobacter roggenkampii TaxID=1812935 RepID=UPI003D1EF209
MIAGKGKENGTILTHTETTVNAGDTLTIVSGRDTNLTGRRSAGRACWPISLAGAAAGELAGTLALEMYAWGQCDSRTRLCEPLSRLLPSTLFLFSFESNQAIKLFIHTVKGIIHGAGTGYCTAGSGIYRCRAALVTSPEH